MESSLKVTIYAAKLKKRKVQLQQEHNAALTAWHKAFAKWKKDVALFVLSPTTANRIADLKVKDVESANRYRGHNDLADKILAGMPDPPIYPSDAKIHKITARLRFLAVTGQNTVRVEEREVFELFGTDQDDE